MEDLKKEICDRHKSLGKWKWHNCTLDLRAIINIDGQDYAFYINSHGFNKYTFYHMSKITDGYFWRYGKKVLLDAFK